MGSLTEHGAYVQRFCSHLSYSVNVTDFRCWLVSRQIITKCYICNIQAVSISQNPSAVQVSREIMAICREASHYSDICTLALPAHQRCQKNFLTCQTLIWWWCKKQPTCFMFIYFAGVVWQLIADVFMQKLSDGMMKAWCDESVL